MSEGQASEENKKTGAAQVAVAASGTEAKSDTVAMAQVESPPLAPALEEAKPELKVEPLEAAAHASSASEAPKSSSFVFPKLPPLPELGRWRGLIAASITFAAGVGAVIGAVAVAPRNMPADTAAAAAAAQEREVMQRTIQKLNQEMSSLRSNIETQAKTTSAQIGKLTDKLKDSEKIVEASRRAAAQSDITGSISAPATVPVPQPRPAASAAASSAASAAALPPKPAVVDGWRIRSARDGLVLVEGRGEIFEVVPGAPLPGLGVVEDVRRENGRWIVVTAKGLILASSQPRRGYYDRY